MGVGARIKKLLKQNGMTIKELSKKTEIPINTLYSITKRDEQNVRSDNLKKIASALGVSINDLLYENKLDYFATLPDVPTESPPTKIRELLEQVETIRMNYKEIMEDMAILSAIDINSLSPEKQETFRQLKKRTQETEHINFQITIATPEGNKTYRVPMDKLDHLQDILVELLDSDKLNE